jgi:hypothetical protein
MNPARGVQGRHSGSQEAYGGACKNDIRYSREAWNSQRHEAGTNRSEYANMQAVGNYAHIEAIITCQRVPVMYKNHVGTPCMLRNYMLV